MRQQGRGNGAEEEVLPKSRQRQNACVHRTKRTAPGSHLRRGSFNDGREVRSPFKRQQMPALDQTEVVSSLVESHFFCNGYLYVFRCFSDQSTAAEHPVGGFGLSRCELYRRRKITRCAMIRSRRGRGVSGPSSRGVDMRFRGSWQFTLLNIHNRAENARKRPSRVISRGSERLFQPDLRVLARSGIVILRCLTNSVCGRGGQKAK